MLKNLLSAILLLFLVTQVNAQDIHKIITKKYVDGLIKTLSSDEMEGRATFTPGIDRAARFIEGEFKKTGLQLLPGLKDYRQTFYKYNVKPISTSLMLDGKNIDSENIVVLGNAAEHVTFDHTSGDNVVTMDSEQPFLAQYRALLGRKQTLVLVDAKFKSFFDQLKKRSQNSSYVDEKDLQTNTSAAMVFVLTTQKTASNFKVELKSSITKLPLFNVAAIIPGKSKAKEMVIFSAHYDHLGIILPAINGDSIANGADDNATGTTAIIALAKYYKKLNNNERTLVFVAFTAEEIGGFGAQYFSEQLNPEEVTAMFNIEMIGKESKFGKNAAFITGFDKSDFGKILQKNLKDSPFKFHPDPYLEQNLFYRSDNATLAALGVPAHTISTDQIDTDELYHTVQDEYDSLATDNILMTIKAIATSAKTIINGSDTPTRIPKLIQ